MRRLALIFGMLLTLTAGAWGSAAAVAAAAAWCVHGASAPSASGGHDCCRAGIGESNAHRPEPQETSCDVSRDTSATRNQVRESRAGTNCKGSDADSAREAVVAVGGLGFSSCAECCAGGSGHAPATTTTTAAPEQNKVKRAAGSNRAGARETFAPPPLDVSHLAPASPAPRAARRHALLGVFLI